MVLITRLSSFMVKSSSKNGLDSSSRDLCSTHDITLSSCLMSLGRLVGNVLTLRRYSATLSMECAVLIGRLPLASLTQERLAFLFPLPVERRKAFQSG